MKILEFFQGISGEMSSKRLGYLSTIPFVLVGTVQICNKLINTGNPDLAVDIWKYFYVYCAVLGGFVSAELIPTILLAVRGINNKEIKNDEKTNN
jgi:hypothetical protein